LTSLQDTLDTCRTRVEQYLDAKLPVSDSGPQQLHQAMRYATLNGGKRLRASLTYLTGGMLGTRDATLDACAGAVELIHAYSLVHDDLPCMDDDDLRRGQPSCHKKFGEATAMLVGDALQTLAFELLAACDDPSSSRLITTLARASGSQGMAGGQALDLEATSSELDIESLKRIHRMKTGALIRAAVMMPAQAARCPDSTLQALDDYAQALGLGFQIRDDILDVIGETDTLGKQAGVDAALGKSTYPGLLGLDGARQAAQDSYQQAVGSLKPLAEDSRQLRELADYVVNRIY
jgi:farnesyl diphosphate synthase